MTQLTLEIQHKDTDGFELCINTEVSLTGVTALFGPSGSGKTTLLNCIAGLRPDIIKANITFAEQSWQKDTKQLSPWERPIGYVFQDARLFPHMTVGQNLQFAEKHAVTTAPDLNQIAQWMNITNLLHRNPESLSAGQQARVAVGRALMRSPKLLLLDEPLANLDRSAATQCLNCLARINREQHLPMIYVSHQIEEISSIADQLMLMANGQIHEQGSLLELASRLDTPLVEDDSAASLLTVQVGSYDADFGLVELQVDGQCLWVAAERMEKDTTSGAEQPGNPRRLRIPARDVSVCRDKPQNSSIQNILPVTLLEIRQLSHAHCILRLQLSEQCFLARITRRAQEDLQLQIGDALYAQIKTTALLGDGL